MYSFYLLWYHFHYVCFCFDVAATSRLAVNHSALYSSIVRFTRFNAILTPSHILPSVVCVHEMRHTHITHTHGIFTTSKYLLKKLFSDDRTWILLNWRIGRRQPRAVRTYATWCFSRGVVTGFKFDQFVNTISAICKLILVWLEPN